MEDLISEYPPVVQQMRYGNRSFRSWYDKFTEEYTNLVGKILPEDKKDFLLVELKPYFSEAFGNSKRIDYGTGHELNFICILYILCHEGVYVKEDLESIVHHLFYKYLLLMRKLQQTYMLEPAGSHGVI